VWDVHNLEIGSLIGTGFQDSIACQALLAGEKAGYLQATGCVSKADQVMHS